MSDYVKNFVYGVVSVAPSPATSGTSLSLSDADAAVFPDPATVGAYNVVVWPAGTKPLTANAEIVRITAKASPSGGNTAFTITRTQESTSARTVVVGDQIALNLTAKTITDLIGMGTASMVRGEVPGGSVNSSNTAFTTASRFQPGSLRVYHNGIRLKGGGVDFTEGTQAFTMVTAPVTGDILLVDYETNTTAFMQGSSSFVYDETPSGTVNGSNVTFTLANTPVAGTLVLYRDGQRLVPGGADYTLATATITFVTAPTTGSILRADYQLFASTAGNADTLDGYHANSTPTAGNIPVLDSGARLPYSDGWTPTGETWTYASATTITVPSGAASRYAKGDKIKLTQTTVKYFYVIGVADTVLTVTGGSDYTVANAAISNNFYSHQLKPIDFPKTFNFTIANWTTSGTAFTNQPTTSTAYFSIIDGICNVWIVALTNATSGGTGVFYANITSGHLPTRSDIHTGSAWNISSNAITGLCATTATNQIGIMKYDATAIAGNSNYFTANITYFYA